MPEGMTAGQAMINRAVLDRGAQDKLSSYQDEQETWLGKKSKYSGWGRFAGALAMGGLAMATGGSSLIIGAAAGLGSRLGSEAGENKADRGNIWGQKKGKLGGGGKAYKPKKLDRDKINFYKSEVDEINRDTKRFERDFDMKQNVDAAKDAYTAFNISNMAQSYGAKAAEEAAKGGGEVAKAHAAEVAGQTPGEGVGRMFGDWKTKAGEIFGKESGKQVVSEAVTDPTQYTSAGTQIRTPSGTVATGGSPGFKEGQYWIKDQGYVAQGSAEHQADLASRNLFAGRGGPEIESSIISSMTGGGADVLGAGSKVASEQLPFMEYGEALKSGNKEQYKGFLTKFHQGGGGTSTDDWKSLWDLPATTGT